MARSRIWVAALLVKVRVKVAAGSMPTSPIKYANRVVMVFVLPLPAPAKIKTGRPTSSTASCCAALSSSKIAFMLLFHGVLGAHGPFFRSFSPTKVYSIAK